VSEDVVPSAPKFRRRFAFDSIQSARGQEDWGAFGYLRGLAMATIFPQGSNQERHNESLRGDERSFDENTDDNLALLEENARLRGLVVRLSSIILKSVAERT
jgi:hypothetical protein